MNISIPHELPQEEALSRIQGFLSKLKEEQKGMVTDVKEDWQGDTGSFQFTAQGFKLSGDITVSPASIDIDASLPLALSFFQGKIKEMIGQKVTALLKPENGA